MARDSTITFASFQSALTSDDKSNVACGLGGKLALGQRGITFLVVRNAACFNDHLTHKNHNRGLM